MNTKMKKRMLSLLLCLVLVVGLMPTTAMAEQQEISEVVATSQDLDSIPQLYGLLKIPEFTVTTGSPAYITASDANLRWQKYDNGDWTNQNAGRFTPGEWRISTSLRLDNDGALQYDFAQNLTFEVNGKSWTVETPNNHGEYSFAWVYSPVFTIVDDPNVQPPVPVESVHMVLNGYAPGAAAASATVTTDANVDVEVLGFLKAIDSNGDGQPDTPVAFTGNFASGEMYVVGLKIKAKSGYDISGLEFQNISLDRAVMTMSAKFDMNEECFLVTYILGDAMQYTVTFETNGGSAIQPVSVGGGGFVAEPTAPTRAYYAFEGWYSDEALTKSFDFATTPITEDTTLYAKWTPSPVDGKFLMTIDFNGGTSTMPSSVPVAANKEVYFEPAETIQSTVTPPSGKVFDAYEIDGVRYEYGDEYIVTQNFTLKLLWKDAAQQPTGHTHDYGQAPNNWDATHHWKECTDQACRDLAGSIKDKAPHSDSDGDGHCDACDVDLIKISFAPGEGTGTMAAVYVTLLPGSVSYDFTLPANGFTAPSGKSFKCWTVAGVEKAAGDNITVNANTTVTAIWENIPVTYYTVTFDSNGGSAVTAQNIEAGQKATKPADPTKSGYDFKGWTLNGSAYDFNTAVNGNITLVATWEQQQVVPTTYTVSFDANGGKVTPASATTGADGKLATLPTPTRSGYRFNGWYTAVIGGKEITEDTVFTENTTVYAHWTKKPTGGSSGGSTTPAKKPVQSVDTGDMGIALYAGMALLSLTGGAWVVNKKRKGK